MFAHIGMLSIGMMRSHPYSYTRKVGPEDLCIMSRLMSEMMPSCHGVVWMFLHAAIRTWWHRWVKMESLPAWMYQRWKIKSAMRSLHRRFPRRLRSIQQLPICWRRQRWSSVLWRTFKYIARDVILLIVRMNALALAEINALSLSLVTPSLLWADDAHDDHALPITSESLVVSSREENIDIVQDGLTFRIADFNADAGSQRLDYVITQVDVSRMARVASRWGKSLFWHLRLLVTLPCVRY